MPGGKTHSAITTTLLVPSFIVASNQAILGGQSEGLFFVGGVVLTFWVNPDLDLVENKSRLHPWNLYWLAYGKLMPHRGKWSHGVFFSTLIRLLYIGWPILLAPGIDKRFLVWVFLGMMSSDILHLMADRISTGIKTRRNRKKLGRKRS